MSSNGPSEPDWTRLCKGTDLEQLRGQPYMLRESDDPGSPWRSVSGRAQGFFTDQESGVVFYYTTVKFYGGGERVINDSDDLEIGLIRPPWWTDDMEPSEWPRR
ncbi:hypothetical protein [Mycobacterium camsae]|uniref:hypothetical protein n=1 Tax=Mycobacterium gordonae TaxID=1778 RepID=UPI00197FC50A|nr:hypothetical protein [Mycobacterium gordonae]